MSSHGRPDWIANLNLLRSTNSNTGYPDTINQEFRHKLSQLSFEELDTLADISGVRDSLAVLTPANEWSHEQYIEILSNTAEMTSPQIERIRQYLSTHQSKNKPY